MSALQDPIGGILDIMTSAQRGMTEWEADWFLRTGQLPDLSQPPVDEASLLTNIPEITEAEARSFLAGQPLVAAGGWGSPSEIVFRFDPNQERGSDGRWIDDVDGGGRTAVRNVLDDPDEVLKIAPVGLTVDRRGRVSLECRPPTLDICSGSEAATTKSNLEYYRGNGYTDINGVLRGQGSFFDPEEVVEMKIDTIRKVVRNSPLPEDVRVLRGLSSAVGLFGEAANTDEDLTGYEWTEQAFVSTTTDPEVLDLFGESDGAVLSIHVPAGTGAVKMSDRPNKHGYNEAEMLLEDGLRMRVVKDRGRDRMGRRMLDVEVVPA